MAELKTKVTTQSVQDYLGQISEETTRKDCLTLCSLMEDIAGSTAKMWGEAIIGIGDYKYQYKDGRSGDWFMMGFSPRKQYISLYILGCNLAKQQEILSRLGKHKTGKGCIYIKTLTDIDIKVLRELCEISCRNLTAS